MRSTTRGGKERLVRNQEWSAMKMFSSVDRDGSVSVTEAKCLRYLQECEKTQKNIIGRQSKTR